MNGTGQLTSQIDALGNRSTSLYDAAGQPVATVNPLADRNTQVYDASGQVIATVNALGSRWTSSYDLAGRRTGSIDPLSRRTTSLYNASSRMIASIDAENHRTTTVYDAAGQTTATVDALANRSTTVFNADGQTVASINALGNRTTSIYDSGGRPSAVLDARGNRTTTVYDSSGRVAATQNPLSHRWSTQYNSVGQAAASIDPLGNRTSSIYDSAGRMAATQLPLGQRTSSVYNVANQTVGKIDAGGNRSTMVYDATGREITQVDALGARTTSVFNSAGQNTGLIDARGNRRTFTYDASGMQTQQIDALGRRTTLAYDTAGQQTLRLDAEGNRTTYSFDPVGRVTGRKYPDGSRATFVYDATGNRTKMHDSTGRYTYSYDALRAMSATHDIHNRRLTYSYDAVGQRRSLQSPSGYFTYTYDAANQNTVVENPFGQRTSFTYDAASRRTVGRNANGTRTSTIYDANSWKTQVDNRTSAGAAIATFEYRYDDVGNPTRVAEASGDRVTWSYDSTDRLLSERRSGTNSYANTFTYDSVGNRTLQIADGTRTTFSYDSGDQLTYSHSPSGRSTFVHDQNGNQRVELPPAGNRNTTTWDYENQPVVYNDGTVRATMMYNADSRRVEKVRGKATYFSWDPVLDAYQYRGASLVNDQAEFTSEPVQFGRYLGIHTNVFTPSTNYYHTDSLGSVRALTDSSQATSDTYLYDAWGNQLSSTGTVPNPFRWVGNVGYYYDELLDKYYIRARVYQPTIARWTSIDPLFYMLAKAGMIGLSSNEPTGDKDGTSAYLYVHGMPILVVDPSGLRGNPLCELWPNICADNTRDPHGCALVGMIPNPAYTPTRNGCTFPAMNGFPILPFTGSFESACNNHDDCWQDCSTSFETCQLRFLGDMISECDALRMSYPAWHPLRYYAYRQCVRGAFIYYRFTNNTRWYWRINQRNACLPVQKCSCGDYFVGHPGDGYYVPWEVFENNHGVEW